MEQSTENTLSQWKVEVTTTLVFYPFAPDKDWAICLVNDQLLGKQNLRATIATMQVNSVEHYKDVNDKDS